MRGLVGRAKYLFVVALEGRQPAQGAAGRMRRSTRYRALRVAAATALAAVSLAAAGLPAGADVPTWSLQSPTTSPTARYGAAMAYDTESGQTVMFGGEGSSGPLDDTWVWNGTTWVLAPSGHHGRPPRGACRRVDGL